jgi:hypothetical protein
LLLVIINDDAMVRVSHCVVSIAKMRVIESKRIKHRNDCGNGGRIAMATGAFLSSHQSEG